MRRKSRRAHFGRGLGGGVDLLETEFRMCVDFLLQRIQTGISRVERAVIQRCGGGWIGTVLQT